MPLNQTQLDFPVRKSSRHRSKCGKENVTSGKLTAKESVKKDQSLVDVNDILLTNVSAQNDFGLKSEVIVSPRRIEQTPNDYITFTTAVSPSKRLANKHGLGSPSKRRALLKNSPKRTPLSPSRLVNGNAQLAKGRHNSLFLGYPFNVLHQFLFLSVDSLSVDRSAV